VRREPFERFAPRPPARDAGDKEVAEAHDKRLADRPRYPGWSGGGGLLALGNIARVPDRRGVDPQLQRRSTVAANQSASRGELDPVAMARVRQPGAAIARIGRSSVRCKRCTRLHVARIAFRVLAIYPVSAQ